MFTATAIAISLASYHFDRTTEHNEVNPGVFVELDHKYLVGVYRNSHWKTTALVARQWHLSRVGPVHFGAILGACTGYKTPVCGGLSVRAGNVTLLVVPPVKFNDDKTRGVIGLSWRQPL